MRPLLVTALCGALLVCSCAKPPAPPPSKITVAAASNLTGTIDQIGAAFKERTGIEVVMSFGSTAQLSQQIANGAPFDVFASADTKHIDDLVDQGLLIRDSRAVYARGQLALWIPNGEKLGVRELKELTRREIRFIACAQPALAPYGEAAVESMKSSGLWEALQPKVVYANSISAARQFAVSGNADAAFTAYSLVLKEQGIVIKIDPKLYKPIDQAVGVVAASQNLAQGRQFADFLVGPEGRAAFSKSGYLVP